MAFPVVCTSGNSQRVDGRRCRLEQDKKCNVMSWHVCTCVPDIDSQIDRG